VRGFDDERAVAADPFEAFARRSFRGCLGGMQVERCLVDSFADEGVAEIFQPALGGGLRLSVLTPSARVSSSMIEASRAAMSSRRLVSPSRRSVRKSGSSAAMARSWSRSVCLASSSWLSAQRGSRFMKASRRRGPSAAKSGTTGRTWRSLWCGSSPDAGDSKWGAGILLTSLRIPSDNRGLEQALLNRLAPSSLRGAYDFARA
jgi:hypothetical protein